MKHIGLLSDTHAYWDDRYLQYFEPCDEIWHAGDIGSLELAMRLSEFRPFKAVFGNCDGGDLRRLYTEKLRWTCEGADILLRSSAQALHLRAQSYPQGAVRREIGALAHQSRSSGTARLAPSAYPHSLHRRRCSLQGPRSHRNTKIGTPLLCVKLCSSA